DLLVAAAPRYAGVRSDYDRVLRQRNALLRTGVRNPDDAGTLEVFDGQLAHVGAALAVGRVRMLERLEPLVGAAYAELAGADQVVVATYECGWWPDGGDDGATVGDDAIGVREQALLEALRER